MPQRILSCRSAILVAYLGLLLYHEFLRGSSTEPQVQVEAQQDAFANGPVHVPSLVLPEATEILGGLGESEPGGVALTTSGSAEKLQQATQVLQNVGEWFGNHEVMATLTEARLESIEKRLETFSRMVDNFSKGLDLTWKQIDFVNKHYTGEVATKLETMMSSVQYFHKQLETLNLQQRTDIDASQQMASNFVSVNSRLAKLEEKSEEDNTGIRRVQFDLEEHLPLLRSMVKEEVQAHRVPEDLDSRMVAVDEATVATINRMGNLEAKVAESERLHAEILSLTDSLIRRDNEINNLTALLLDLVKSVHTTQRNPGAPPHQECRSPYLRVGQLCLATTRTPTPWLHARDACLGSGGQLALPSNLTLFARYLRSNNVSGEVWVGGSELIRSLDPQPSPASPRETGDQQTTTVTSNPQHEGTEDDSALRKANQGANSPVSGKQSTDSPGSKPTGPEQAESTRHDQCLAVVLRQEVHAVLRLCRDHNIAVCQQNT
ncbi:uncharacterized protein LOC134784516 [Penaeus indicus]|uniref:uncharacterized protein LOC134784516 n=1 Tax=Penaeus indicus TaxID=29960 RepID=UPI00300C8E42